MNAMKKLLLISLSTLFGLLSMSCGKKDTAVSITNELVDKYDEVSAVIEVVEDSASAEDAVQKLAALGDELLAIASRAQSVEVDDIEELEQLDRVLKQAVSPVMDQLSAKMQQLSGDPKTLELFATGVEDFASKVERAERAYLHLSKGKPD